MDRVPNYVSSLVIGRRALLCFLCGGISVLSMPPFDFWPILFLTFPTLIWCLDAEFLSDPVRYLIATQQNLSGLPRGNRFFTRPFLFVATGTRIAAVISAPVKTLARVKAGRAGILGWSFGFGYFMASIYWIAYAFFANPVSNNGLAAAGAILAVLGLSAALAVFYGFAAAFSMVLWRGGYARLAGFVFCFHLAELARSFLFTGFPWNLFGLAFASSDTLRQSASYVGVYGLTLLALFIFTSPAAAISRNAVRSSRRFMPFCLSLLALLGMYAFGERRLGASTEMSAASIRIVQPNIAQIDKWKPENRRWIFERIRSLSQSGTGNAADISNFNAVVWPESSVPFLFMVNGKIAAVEARQALAALIPAGTRLIAGAERADGHTSDEGKFVFDRVFNSLFVLGHGARIDAIYDKQHLVPFGEYMPFAGTLKLLGLQALSHQLDGFQMGANSSPSIAVPGLGNLKPFICYEIIFPGKINDSQSRPDVMVNITNDAWFGNSTGPYQHLQQAQIRATEEGIPVIRSANTGISAIIDGNGRIIAKVNLGITGVIDSPIPKPQVPTLYARARRQIFIILIALPFLLYLLIILKDNSSK